MATPPTLDDRQLDALTGATVELLQVLIRNRCVNDGTADSGEEVRNADVLQQVIAGPGVRRRAVRGGTGTRVDRRADRRARTPTRRACA